MMSLLSSRAVRSYFWQRYSSSHHVQAPPKEHWLDEGHTSPSHEPFKMMEAARSRTGHTNSRGSDWGLCGQGRTLWYVSDSYPRGRSRPLTLAEKKRQMAKLHVWLSCMYMTAVLPGQLRLQASSPKPSQHWIHSVAGDRERIYLLPK